MPPFSLFRLSFKKPKIRQKNDSPASSLYFLILTVVVADLVVARRRDRVLRHGHRRGGRGGDAGRGHRRRHRLRGDLVAGGVLGVLGHRGLEVPVEEVVGGGCGGTCRCEKRSSELWGKKQKKKTRKTFPYLNENGSLTVLKPSSCILQTTLTKSATIESDTLPHRPSGLVWPFS